MNVLLEITNSRSCAILNRDNRQKKEERMKSNAFGRRDFLGRMTALAAGVPAFVTVSSRLADAAGAGPQAKIDYNPAAKLPVSASARRHSNGTTAAAARMLATRPATTLSL